MISEELPGCVRDAGPRCVGAVFSTVSPLGRHLTNVSSFPCRSPRPRGKSCAIVQLLHYHRTHCDSVSHSCVVEALAGLEEDTKCKDSSFSVSYQNKHV